MLQSYERGMLSSYWGLEIEGVCLTNFQKFIRDISKRKRTYCVTLL